MPAHALATVLRATLLLQLVALPLAASLRAETATPPATGTLKPPAHPQHATPAPKPPKAAPREAVRQVGPAKHPPTVQPDKSAHAQKAPAKHGPAKGGVAAVPTPDQKPPEPAPAAEQKPPELPKGTATGLPLPRFAALRSDEVNMRAGPGTRYPIDWVYKRRDLPVEIEREFEVWRLVKDPDGTKGWVHQATLTGRRTLIVTGGIHMLRRQPDDNAPPVAELKPGVLAHLRSCEAGSAWCQVQVGEYRGYLKRDQFWGAQPGEAVN